MRVRPAQARHRRRAPRGHLEDDDPLEAEPALELLQRIDADADADLLGAARSSTICGTMRLIVLTGTAKPMPADAPLLL